MLQTFNCTRIVIIFFSRPILSIFQNYISTTIACSFLLLGATLKNIAVTIFYVVQKNHYKVFFKQISKIQYLQIQKIAFESFSQKEK